MHSLGCVAFTQCGYSLAPTGQTALIKIQMTPFFLTYPRPLIQLTMTFYKKNFHTMVYIIIQWTGLNLIFIQEHKTHLFLGNNLSPGNRCASGIRPMSDAIFFLSKSMIYPQFCHIHVLIFLQTTRLCQHTTSRYMQLLPH